MRLTVACLAVVIGTTTLLAAPAADAPARRYGVEADLEVYPQDTPQHALGSVLKAIDARRVNYLLAQLADPEWVDARIAMEGGTFDDLVKETSAKLSADPAAVKELGRFLREGTWDVQDATASAQLKDVAGRAVYLRKVGGRWFLENRQKASAEGK